MRLLVRDDGSTDATRSILADYAARQPQAVTVVDLQGPRLGPCGSFARLLEQSSAPYVMLCDQDDVWLPEKTAAMLGRMKELEGQLGGQTPLLVHSDLVVVDDALKTLHRSFWAYQRLDPVRGSALNRLLVENVVAGCGAMLNRALVLECLPIPTTAVMHDWWIALVTASRGRLEYIPQATVLYRQHAANRIGTNGPELPGPWPGLFPSSVATDIAAICTRRNGKPRRSWNDLAQVWTRKLGRWSRPTPRWRTTDFSSAAGSCCGTASARQAGWATSSCGQECEGGGIRDWNLGMGTPLFLAILVVLRTTQ